ncbi:MAG: 4Fe-4S dicluster domain-containing protein [Deltaproteobacteria bacterium]|nr:4Fe-4S dicluster domain-containing protein [Deltaproteobacteria bacterium]MBW1928177.1 4Fe-4S dicluster domain-containing protein [Deltaproteobacteria bacterium]RLB19306.1 MAG: heterodisulfide reductase [Deltaproteobacteria bacterium]
MMEEKNHIMSDAHVDIKVRDFARQVVEEFGEERMYACFECGQCAACCPVHRVNAEFSPRKIIHMVLLGMMDEVLDSRVIWLCSTCYTCQETCPQGIKVTDLIIAIRNMAYERGSFPDGIKMQADLISAEGRLYSLDEFDQKKRQKANLPPVLSRVEEAVKLLEDRK